jgi:membrane associated rhomboid family serine protease
MFALFIFGTFLERKIRERDFLLIYFIAGIIGNIGYMLTAPTMATPGLGASGAIYGIMGALAILYPTATVYVFYIPMPMIIAAFVWGATEFLGLFAPGSIAHGAHIGGLFIGILYGFYLRRQSQQLSRNVIYTIR